MEKIKIKLVDYNDSCHSTYLAVTEEQLKVIKWLEVEDWLCDVEVKMAEDIVYREID